jgi:hypothetical protein
VLDDASAHQEGPLRELFSPACQHRVGVTAATLVSSRLGCALVGDPVPPPCV